MLRLKRLVILLRVEQCKKAKTFDTKIKAHKIKLLFVAFRFCAPPIWFRTSASVRLIPPGRDEVSVERFVRVVIILRRNTNEKLS
jgi:hypothetical protein